MSLVKFKTKSIRDKRISDPDFEATTFDMSKSNLEHLPEFVSNMRNLQSLHLENNKLTTFDITLPQLKSLHLEHNHLQEIPSCVYELSNLEKLFVPYNQITKISPDIQKLSQLQQLKLHNNRLTKLPPELCLLQNLTTFTVFNNPYILSPPLSVCKNGSQAILSYLEALLQGSRGTKVPRFHTTDEIDLYYSKVFKDHKKLFVKTLKMNSARPESHRVYLELDGFVASTQGFRDYMEDYFLVIPKLTYRPNRGITKIRAFESDDVNPFFVTYKTSLELENISNLWKKSTQLHKNLENLESYNLVTPLGEYDYLKVFTPFLPNSLPSTEEEQKREVTEGEGEGEEKEEPNDEEDKTGDQFTRSPSKTTTAYDSSMLSSSLNTPVGMTQKLNFNAPKPTTEEEDDKTVFSIYGVFDGHGGERAAQYCCHRLVYHIFSSWALTDPKSEKKKKDSPSPTPKKRITVTPGVGCSLESLKCLEGILSPEAITRGYLRANYEFSKFSEEYDLNDGSTSCLAIICGNKLITAHTGDTRAVLCRDRKAFRLTSDHKPSRPDERKRIMDAGGVVKKINGVSRVQGVLATSRVIGDRHLAPYTTAQPEIRVEVLTPLDQFIIIATDGVWDVITDQEAVNMARRTASAEQAAFAISKRAYARGSGDNITTLVVFFRWDSY